MQTHKQTHSLATWYHCMEKHIFFFRTSWKDVLSKKIAQEYDLFHIIEKDHVSLSRKYDLNLRRKMKDDLFQKNARKYDIFFRSSEKKVFSKRSSPGHDLSCIIWKDGIFFPKAWYFFLGQKASDDLSQEIHENMIFSVYTCMCYKTGVTPPAKNNEEWLYPVKINLKVIDVWHPGKSSTNSLYLHKDLYGHFHVLHSSEKNRKLNI